MFPRIFLLLPLLALGCAEGPMRPDPEVLAKWRELFVLDVEPADAVTALEWRDSQLPDEAVDLTAPANSPDKITLVGTVGGMPNPFGEGAEESFPWRSGQAAFFLVDPSTAAEFADHASEAGDDHAADCPFCAREAANKLPAVAAVMFTAEDGAPVPIEARELFGLEEGSLVVVRGKPSQMGDLLTIEADSLFVRN